MCVLPPLRWIRVSPEKNNNNTHQKFLLQNLLQADRLEQKYKAKGDYHDFYSLLNDI